MNLACLADLGKLDNVPVSMNGIPLQLEIFQLVRLDVMRRSPVEQWQGACHYSMPVLWRPAQCSWAAGLACSSLHTFPSNPCSSVIVSLFVFEVLSRQKTVMLDAIQHGALQQSGLLIQGL